MRIAYVARWDVSHESGILKKMVSQVHAWLERGHDVTLFALSPGDRVWRGIEDVRVHAFHGDSLWTRLTWRRAVSGPILGSRPDLLYLRFSTWYPALERVMDRVPTIVEINGDDIAENRLSLSAPLFLAHRLTRERLLRRARGFVFVTRELSRRCQYAKYGRPGLVLANGIELDALRPAPPARNDRPRLVFVGYSDCAWHGLDKLNVLARALPNWRIDIVGVPAPSNGSTPPNLVFHGHLEHSRYLRLLETADVAIGTLGLHRKGMDEASPLKTREYLALGVPTVIGYDDTDLPDGHPLLLRLPNTEDNVAENIEGIRDFVERVKGKRVPREDVVHLDLAAKEDARLKFFEQVLSS